jgi:hypothetical protein
VCAHNYSGSGGGEDGDGEAHKVGGAAEEDSEVQGLRAAICGAGDAAPSKGSAPPMKNTFAARVLFAQAKAHVEEILTLVGQYNDIAALLREMGYMSGTERDGSDFWPLLELDVWGNQTTDVTDDFVSG